MREHATHRGDVFPAYKWTDFLTILQPADRRRKRNVKEKTMHNDLIATNNAVVDEHIRNEGRDPASAAPRCGSDQRAP